MSDHNAPVLELDLPDEAATCALGAALAPALRPGLSVHLHGELGAGKTTLVRAILVALGHPGRVKSPTYTLVELYTLSRLNLYHFDFYRFRDTHEWREAGFSDYFDGGNVCLVEWPEKAGDALPAPDLDITLQLVDAPHGATDTNTGSESEVSNARRATLVARSTLGAQCLASLENPTMKSPRRRPGR